MCLNDDRNGLTRTPTRKSPSRGTGDGAPRRHHTPVGTSRIAAGEENDENDELHMRVAVAGVKHAVGLVENGSAARRGTLASERGLRGRPMLATHGVHGDISIQNYCGAAAKK